MTRDGPIQFTESPNCPPLCPRLPFLVFSPPPLFSYTQWTLSPPYLSSPEIVENQGRGGRSLTLFLSIVQYFISTVVTLLSGRMFGDKVSR